MSSANRSKSITEQLIDIEIFINPLGYETIS